jgi:SAM-dependent methyltransferase
MNQEPKPYTVDHDAERDFYDARAAAGLRLVITDPCLTEQIIPWNYRFFVDVLAKHIGGLDHLEGKRVLDCGCGTGKLAVFLAKWGAMVTAFDISPKSIEICRQVAKKSQVEDRVKAEVGVFEDLDYPKASFDLIMGLSILHHVDIRGAMSQVHRLLKPKGLGLFWENSDRNPIIRILHRYARQLHVKKRGTPTERILGWYDLQVIKKEFGSGVQVYPAPFFFFSLAKEHLFDSRLKSFGRLLEALDHFISDKIPSLRPYSFHQVILVRGIFMESYRPGL